MATSLKCPNPSCPYLFDPTSVPSGVLLACPRCAMRFTLGGPTAYPPGQPPQPPSDYAGFSPAGYPNQASPPFGPAGNPSYNEAASSPPAVRTDTAPTARPGRLASPRVPVRSSRLQTILLAGVSAVALAAASIVVWYKITHRDEAGTAESAPLKYKEVNFSIEPPPSPWIRDEETRVLLGSPYFLVYKRDNPEAYMAFGARDYDPRSPRESELQGGLLNGLFKVIDSSSLKQMDPRDNSWMGRETKGFQFRGQLKSGSAVQGEAYRCANRGIAYWFLGWTGDNDIFEEMQPSFSEARRHCKLLDLRSEWKEKQSAIQPFKGDRIGYTLLDAEAVWEEEKDESLLKYEGEGADKLLKVKRGKKRDELQDARLIVWILPPGGDPLTQAVKFVEEKRTKEIKAAGDYPIDFREISGPLEGDAIPDPIDPIPVKRFASIVKGAASQNRFHVVSGIAVGDKIVAVHAYCSASKRSTLETTLVQIASSLHEVR